MLATPSEPAKAHRILDRLGITIGTLEYAVWSKSIREKARARTQKAMRRQRTITRR